jgi:DNA replication and repair protein RecF
MEIKSLFLKNFRNYETAEISEFSSSLNVFTGRNAQGKTNIIEAFTFLASGKSFRTSKDNCAVREGSNEAYARASFLESGVLRSVEMLLCRGRKKAFKIGGTPVRKMSELYHALTVVVFSPEDLRIVKEAPDLRRRFLDEEICKIRPSYLDALKNFNKLIREKSAALRQPRPDGALVGAYNRQLAAFIAIILKNRESYLTKLTSNISGVLHTMELGEEIAFSYRKTLPKEGIEQALWDAMPREITERQCLLGPQRDEVVIKVNGREAKYFASQGQIRLIMLATKISAVRIIKDATGKVPVLLLDDVFSELDAARKDWTIKNLSGMQTFITTADEQEAKRINGRTFAVETGRIRAL